MVMLTTMRTRRTIFTRGGRLKEIWVFDVDLRMGRIKYAFKDTISETYAFLKDIGNIMCGFNC